MNSKKTLMILAAQAVAFSVYAQTEPSNTSEENNESQEDRSLFDRAIETICEAVIQNPDYGKDISER